jgi:hypothetical protein
VREYLTTSKPLDTITIRLEDEVSETAYVEVDVIFDTVKAQGRKLRWLAEATGVSLSYITKMQCGDRPARREWAERAASALGLPPSLFLPRSSRNMDEKSSNHGGAAD